MSTAPCTPWSVHREWYQKGFRCQKQRPGSRSGRRWICRRHRSRPPRTSPPASRRLTGPPPSNRRHRVHHAGRIACPGPRESRGAAAPARMPSRRQAWAPLMRPRATPPETPGRQANGPGRTAVGEAREGDGAEARVARQAPTAPVRATPPSRTATRGGPETTPGTPGTVRTRRHRAHRTHRTRGRRARRARRTRRHREHRHRHREHREHRHRHREHREHRYWHRHRAHPLLSGRMLPSRHRPSARRSGTPARRRPAAPNPRGRPCRAANPGTTRARGTAADRAVAQEAAPAVVAVLVRAVAATEASVGRSPPRR